MSLNAGAQVWKILSLRQNIIFSTCLFDVTAHHVTKNICFEQLKGLSMKGLAVHLGYAHCWPAGLNSKREFIRPKDRMIASGCFGAGNHPRPPPKKIKAPGGYKPGKTTAVLKRNVSEFCQKKSLIASWKNIILTWLDIWVFLLLLPEQRAPGITSAFDQGTGCASCRFPKQNLSHCLKEAVAVVICWIFLGKLPGIFLRTLGTP